MFARVRLWLWQLLISLDQLGHVILGGPKFILVGGTVPNADETISSKVGRASLEGKRWARIAEKVIDWFAYALAGQTDHCLRSIGH